MCENIAIALERCILAKIFQVVSPECAYYVVRDGLQRKASKGISGGDAALSPCLVASINKTATDPSEYHRDPCFEMFE
jgi:hypothetical protein